MANKGFSAITISNSRVGEREDRSTATGGQTREKMEGLVFSLLWERRGGKRKRRDETGECSVLTARKFRTRKV